MKKLILYIFLFFVTFTAFAQNEADSTLVIARDVIIKTNGNLFQCKIVEVNDSLVNYKLPDKDTTGQINNVLRSEVYAISYGNGTAMVITPELMGKEADIYPAASCEAWETFKNNLGAGSINVGIGFINQYSPIKNDDSFEDEQSMPTVFAGYTFRINKFLKGGAHLEIGGNKLTKSGESEYDQLRVSTEIDMNFISVGLFCRYDVLKGPFKPYVKGGVNFIGVNMETISEAESLDGSNFSIKTVVNQSGIKPGLILRAGMDIYFGNTFGIYGDVGTGLSLVQVGVLFNFE